MIRARPGRVIPCSNYSIAEKSMSIKTVPFKLLSGLLLLFWIHPASSYAGMLNVVNFEANVNLFSFPFSGNYEGEISYGGKKLLDVKFTNDRLNAYLTVMPLYTFEDTIWDDSQHLRLSISDDWKIDATFDFYDLTGDAKLLVDINLQHNTWGCKGDLNQGAPFIHELPEISAEAFRKANKPESGTFSFKAHPPKVHNRQIVTEPPHWDQYSGKLGYNLDYGRDHFDKWTFECEAHHVPAPGAFILGSVGLSFSGWLLRRRRML